MGGKGDTPDRKEEPGSPPKVVRLRIMDPVLLSCASLIIGFLSYLGATSSREDAKRTAELQALESRAREYTNERVHYVEGSLNSLRDFSKEVNKRQDDQIEYLRKLMIQVAK